MATAVGKVCKHFHMQFKHFIC